MYTQIVEELLASSPSPEIECTMDPTVDAADVLQPGQAHPQCCSIAIQVSPSQKKVGTQVNTKTSTKGEHNYLLVFLYVKVVNSAPVNLQCIVTFVFFLECAG